MATLVVPRKPTGRSGIGPGRDRSGADGGFWTTFVLTVVWVAASAWEYELAIGLFGEKGTRLLGTLLMGDLAALSGLLVLHHRRTGGDEEYWTGAELVYVLVLFLSLFYGIYSFFGWFFYA